MYSDIEVEKIVFLNWLLMFWMTVQHDAKHKHYLKIFLLTSPSDVINEVFSTTQTMEKSRVRSMQIS